MVKKWLISTIAATAWFLRTKHSNPWKRKWTNFGTISVGHGEGLSQAIVQKKLYALGWIVFFKVNAACVYLCNVETVSAKGHHVQQSSSWKIRCLSHQDLGAIRKQRKCRAGEHKQTYTKNTEWVSFYLRSAYLESIGRTEHKYVKKINRPSELCDHQQKLKNRETVKNS